MSENRGKDFEAQVRKCFNMIDNVSVDRLLDPQAGFAGVRNICDFIIYKKPTIYYVECKSCNGNTLNFHNITDNQWNGMLAKTTIDGVVAGVMIWFVAHDKTVFIPIQVLQKLRQNGAKSVNVKDIEKLGLIIKASKRRVLFDYDFTEFLNFESWDLYELSL